MMRGGGFFIYAVYLDAFILENTLLDLATILAVSVWSKRPLGVKRLFLSVFFGVVGGVNCFLLIHVFWLYLALVFLVVNPVMLRLAFGKMSMGELGNLYLEAVAVNLVLGGTMNLLRQYFLKEQYSWIVPTSVVCVVFLAVCLLRRKAREETYVKTSVLVNGRVMTFTALRDTGNCLRDPLTGRPVCIVSCEVCQELAIPQESLRPISYETVAGKNTLYIYPVSKFYVMQKGEMVERKGMMLGFANKTLFTGKKYQMILQKEFC